jgi:hypothetical protein
LAPDNAGRAADEFDEKLERFGRQRHQRAGTHQQPGLDVECEVTDPVHLVASTFVHVDSSLRIPLVVSIFNQTNVFWTESPSQGIAPMLPNCCRTVTRA